MGSQISGRVGHNVREIRQRKGLTQVQLCELLEAEGLSIRDNSLSRLESGLRGVDVDDLFALARALDVQPVELLADPELAKEADLMSSVDEWEYRRVRLASELLQAVKHLMAAQLKVYRALQDDEAKQQLVLKVLAEDIGPDAAQRMLERMLDGSTTLERMLDDASGDALDQLRKGGDGGER